MLNDVSQVRKDLSEIVGSKILLETSKGRQKSARAAGTIENIYPSIFTISLDPTQERPKRTVSYSYTDILTKSVEITLME